MAVLLLAAGSYAIKASGYLVLGDRPGIKRWAPVLDLFPPALLAALVVVQTVGLDRALAVDARLPGVIAGSIAAWKKAPFPVVLLVAAGVTAGIRALS
ncbi:MAG: AzlD domain-containing protein [Acidimicrobiales bacterium]